MMPSMCASPTTIRAACGIVRAGRWLCLAHRSRHNVQTSATLDILVVSNELPDRLRSRRVALHKSIKDVCLRARISRSYYFDLEHKQGVRPSAEVLERLAQVLETTTSYLLGPTDLGSGPPVGGLAPELAAVVARLKIPPAEARMLNAIRWQGRAPRTEEDWAFLAEAARRSCSD
jgi:transcriptional regulator with XRE-family HTH domain